MSGGTAMAGPERGARAVIFDLWDTLVPLPARVRAAAVEGMAEALDLPVAALRDAWAATWTRRATGPLQPVVADIYRELTGRSATREQIAAALRARRDVHAPAFVPMAAAAETLRTIRADGVRIGLLTNCTLTRPTSGRPQRSRRSSTRRPSRPGKA
jgi:putative hydrolase of the HAD superfamily